jgi:hypothetical protein
MLDDLLANLDYDPPQEFNKALIEAVLQSSNELLVSPARR